MPEKPLNNKYVRNVSGEKPVFLEMPHSGVFGLGSVKNIPAVIAKKVRVDSQEVLNAIHWGCDSAVPTMTNYFELQKKHGLPAIYNLLGRVFCDTNRDKEQVSDWALEGGTPNDHHHGVIWARTILADAPLDLPADKLESAVREKCEKILSEPLTPSEFNILMAEIYNPYHAGVKFHHRASIDRHGFCIHLALHSLPALSVKKVLGGYVTGQKASRGPFDSAKNTLPDVILIHNNYKAADKVLVDRVRYAFEAGGLIVENGQGPFLGDIGITKIYGDPTRGVNIIGIEHVSHDIEINRHLGGLQLNMDKAREMQKYYEQAIANLLAE